MPTYAASINLSKGTCSVAEVPFAADTYNTVLVSLQVEGRKNLCQIWENPVPTRRWVFKDISVGIPTYAGVKTRAGHLRLF